MRTMKARTFLGLTLAAAVLPAWPTAAQSPPAPDAAMIWSIQGENASISTANLTDRDYTNGIRLGWTSAEGGVPGFLQGVGQTLWGNGQQRISVDITQQIYTPTNTNTPFPPLTDRPYAGVLMGTVSLIHDGAAARSVLGLGLGMVGPSALGEQVQNGFHDLIGQNRALGWDTQLHDEPLLQITSSRTWRLPIGPIGALETDALPEITAGVGNLRIYAQGGITLRLGQGLDSDYGVARILPGLTGTDVFRPTRPFAWYVFAGADGQAVAHDITLDGNTWQNSRSVKIMPAVGEFQAGLAVMAYGVRLTYTHVFQTQEYQHQKGGLHQFGSLALSARF
jgi:lipid A 3-O-deacylase